MLYLIRTGAPAEVFVRIVTCRLEAGGRSPSTYVEEQQNFLHQIDNMKVSHDWFTGNIPIWLWLFDKYELAQRADLNVLEIGSWEGLSSRFILATLPNARLHCVDTWEGADEHKSGLQVQEQVLSEIEAAFNANLAPFRDRVTTSKGTSLLFFAGTPEPESFDLIYIDGSHYCDDVLIDALKGFELLKVGGLIIFDDYRWVEYNKLKNNPASAINSFLRLKKGEYRIVRVYYQLIVEKTASARRSVTAR